MKFVTPTRREFLQAAAGTAGGLSLAGPLSLVSGQAPAAPRIRKDIATLKANSPDIMALKTAVSKMKAMPPAQCESWAGWSAIHGTVGGPFNKCQHGNWFIWPWHRMYVYFFEQIVINLSGFSGFALPYWDWSRNPSVPDLFWQAPLLDTTRVVTQGQMIPTPSFNQFVSPTVISQILNIANFGTFGGTASGGGQVEFVPHNFIHRWISGDMATAGSPTDPIFWMHHCNCDRLYSTWISKHPGRLPTAPAWLNREFKDFCNKGLQVSQTSNSTALGYTYDRLAALVAAVAVQALPELSLVEGPAAKPELVEKVVTFSLAPKDRLAAAVRRVVGGAVDLRNSTIGLELSGVKVPPNQNVRVSVFINAPNPSPDLPVTDPHYVASFTFFAGTHKKDNHQEKTDGHGTVALALDATHTLIRLYGDTTFGANEALRVQVVAAPLFPERGEQWKGTVQDLSPAEVKMTVAGPKP
jgi:tyrosinase